MKTKEYIVERFERMAHRWFGIEFISVEGDGVMIELRMVPAVLLGIFLGYEFLVVVVVAAAFLLGVM